MEKKVSFMRNTLKMVETNLKASLLSIFGIDGRVTVTHYKNNDFDYQSPYAMMYFKRIKKNNKTSQKFKNPKELSMFLKTELTQNYSDIFKKIDVSSNGFLLLLLKEDYLLCEINKILKNPIQIEKNTNPGRTVVDFSSPNIAKEMHVGHLRSTIMGESICRVFEFLGTDVKRVNHLGDWGTQFGMLIAHLQEKYPNYMDESPNLKDLETFYKESKKRFDDDMDFKKKAQLLVVDLQSGNEDCLKAWKVLCEISRQFFTTIYKRLDVTNEEFGESFYNSMIPSVLKELDEKKLTKMDDGALCLFVPKKKVPLMLVKSDGGYNYDTTDMAAARYRLLDLKADRVVYLTDVGQWTHFEKIFLASGLAGWHKKGKTRMEHMGFGVILGEDGKRMKTRSGKTVKLMMLLDEAKEKAKEQLLERYNSSENTTQIDLEQIDRSAEILGIASIKYYDLKQNRIQDYKFIMKNMLSQKGDTAVYLLYSYIRLCSILRKSGFSEKQLLEKDFIFTDEHEKILARHIVQFSETIIYVSENLALNFLCKFLYDLATKVAEGYNKYRITNNEHSLSRSQLIYVVKKLMERCFYLLSIQTIDKI